MNGFRLSPAAHADIDKIWDYTAGRWGEAQAERHILVIRDACRELAEGTCLSHSSDDVRPGYLKAAVGSHILFFRRSEAGWMDITRFLHQRMDIAHHLQASTGLSITNRHTAL